MIEDYVKVENIFQPVDIENLLSYYHSIKANHWHQQYNLFDVERRDVPGSVKKLPEFSMLEEYAGMKTSAHYFLKYTEGSFARSHEDNKSDLTIVTVLNTKDLLGGQAICKLPYEAKSRPSWKKAARSGKEKNVPPYGVDIINYIINVKDGDSIVYGPSLKHSVSLVTQGHRIVLISWFKE